MTHSNIPFLASSALLDNPTSLDNSFSPFMKDMKQFGLEQFHEVGIPNRSWEDWKYTDLSPLLTQNFSPSLHTSNSLLPKTDSLLRYKKNASCVLCFMNGKFSPKDSSSFNSKSESSFPGLKILPLKEAFQKEKKTLERFMTAQTKASQNPFSSLNQAFMEDGTFIQLDPGTTFNGAIHLIYYSDGAHENSSSEAPLSSPRNIIVLGDNAHLNLLESYVSFGNSSYFTNSVTQIELGEQAALNHCRIQSESPRAFHMGSTQILQKKASQLQSFSLNVGGQLARNQLSLIFLGEDGNASLNGLYLGKKNQFLDQYLDVVHDKPHCSSSQLFKGILDEHSRAVFNGKVTVTKNAEKTRSSQLNKNILLSKNARVDTKPQLNIDADDVQCTHGATIGQLSEEELFYLQSRAIPKETATSMLLHGFMNDVLKEVRHRVMKEKLLRFTCAFFFDPEKQRGKKEEGGEILSGGNLS